MKAQHYLNCIITIFFSIFILAFIGGCVTAKQQALDAGMKPLNDRELQSLFSNSFQASFNSNQGGGTSVIRYHSNGTQKLINAKIRDKGTWRIVNGELCSKWESSSTVAESCTTWIKIADNIFDIYLRNQRKSGVLTIIK